MAMLEKIWPPTWKAAIGSVLRIMARVGVRRELMPKRGCIKSKQYPDTNANCTNVRVTGYRNCIIIDFPVLDESAEVRYHSPHSAIKRIVDTEGVA